MLYHQIPLEQIEKDKLQRIIYTSYVRHDYQRCVKYKIQHSMIHLIILPMILVKTIPL